MQKRAEPIIGRVEKGVGDALDRAIRGSEIGDIYVSHMSSSD
jgi:hypothetical protein